MEYVGQYRVMSRAHARPYARVCAIHQELAQSYPEVTITLRQDGRSSSCDSILGLLFSQIGTVVGSNVEVVVKGERDEKTLEGIANRVGDVFARSDVMADAPRMMLGIRRR